MDTQAKFIEMIEDVTNLAKINKREVTIEFLEEYFKELHLQESQMNMVFDYLIQHNIKVKGYDKKPVAVEEKEENTAGNSIDEEESEFLKMYLDEVEGVKSKLTLSEELIKLVSQNDEEAKEKIIEIYLPKVISIAKEYNSQGVSQSDLIQDGNVGLLIGISYLSGDESVEAAKEILDSNIRENMLLSIDEVNSLKKNNRNIIKKADTVKEKAEELAEAMNDKMTMEEMADYMDMDLSEVEDILRITGDEL